MRPDVVECRGEVEWEDRERLRGEEAFIDHGIPSGFETSVVPDVDGDHRNDINLRMTRMTRMTAPGWCVRMGMRGDVALALTLARFAFCLVA
jgi:hypothetical protein